MSASAGVDGARAALASAQVALLAALVAGGPVPDGFDPRRVQVQATALVAKRRTVVAALRPDLAAACGQHFAREFAEYAASRPRPPQGARADAEAFGQALAVKGLLPTTGPSSARSGTRRERLRVLRRQPLPHDRERCIRPRGSGEGSDTATDAAR